MAINFLQIKWGISVVQAFFDDVVYFCVKMLKYNKEIMLFCAYRERCRSEIVEKLKTLGVPKSEENAYLDYLSNENFWNEKRFAALYVRSKFNQNHWGRLKILEGLRAKSVDKHYFDYALAEINEEEYRQKLKHLYEKKVLEIGKPSTMDQRSKIYRYLVSKGYESDLILELIRNGK